MASLKSDIDIIERYLSGDRKTNDYIEGCINVAFRPWRERFDWQRDDIISDTRYKLYISLKHGDFAQKSSLRTYISGILRHTCLDYYRAVERIEKVSIDEYPQVDESISAEDKLEKRQVAMLNFRVLRLVPRECLELWKLRLREGLKCRAIGKRLGKSEVNVRGKLMKCRQKTREIREKLQKKEKRF